LIGLGLFGAMSLGTTSMIDVKRTPTRPMTKTDPMSPKIANPRESPRISDDLRRVLKLGGILDNLCLSRSSRLVRVPESEKVAF
jgi:hypothetical protein